MNARRSATSPSLTRRDTFGSFCPSGRPYRHALQEELSCSEMRCGFRRSVNTSREEFYAASKLLLIAWMRWSQGHCLNKSSQPFVCTRKMGLNPWRGAKLKEIPGSVSRQSRENTNSVGPEASSGPRSRWRARGGEGVTVNPEISPLSFCPSALVSLSVSASPSTGLSFS